MRQEIDIEFDILEQFKQPLWESEKRYIALSGGVASGKSHAICQRMCYLFMTEEDKQFLAVRRGYVGLKMMMDMGESSIIRMLEGWGIPAEEWYNRADRALYNPYNDNKILFMTEEDVKTLARSHKFNYAWVEEPVELEKKTWVLIDWRVSRFIGAESNQIFISYNPISRDNWTVQTFAVDPYYLEKDIELHFSTFKDNHFLSSTDKKYYIQRGYTDWNYYRVYVTGELGFPTLPLVSDNFPKYNNSPKYNFSYNIVDNSTSPNKDDKQYIDGKLQDLKERWSYKYV